MPSEFLHAFAEENPEVQKKMGCITGVFQMLDRYHLFKGRRLHKRFPSGHALLNSSSVGADCSACSPQVVLEKKLSKSSNENQGVSMESSGTSFSSSSCSSFSSLECHRSTRQEPSSMDRTSLERSMRNSAGLKNSDVSSRHIYYESLSDPSYASAQSGRQSFDFCDVVKGSIDREACSLSVKTSTKEEVKNQTPKHRDSPRLMQLSKSADRSYMTGVDGKSRLPADLSESLQVLVKLKESPWYCSEASEQPRSSCEAKDTSFFRASKEAPRFSYDGREIWCTSLDPQDVSRPVSKLKELPRLSLDSREGFLRRSNFDSKPNSILKDSDRSTINQGVSTDSKFQQGGGSHKCPTSVVAKLMGLEPMPNMGLACQKPVNLTETYTSKASDPFNGPRNRNSIAKSLQATQDSRKDHLSHSPKSSLKHPISWLKKSDPDDDSRLPIETAPLRQQERIHIPQNTKLGYQEAHSKQQPESVYSEMERRLKEVEFHKSNDLRALKQIYDAMQAKGMLEAKKGEDQYSGVSVSKNYSGQTPAENDHNFKSTNTHKLHDTQPFPTLMKGSHTPRANESPIVIMKPAKSVIKSGVSASSAIPLEGLSGLQRLQTSHSMYRKKTSTNNRRVKEQTSNAKPKEPTYQPLLSMDKKSIKKTEEISMQKTHVQIEQFSSRHQQSPRENNSSSVKTSGTLSPRIQERKIETEKRSCSPFSSSESNKSQRSSANRQYLESVSPRVRLGQKPAQVHQKDDQLSDLSSGKKSLSHPGDEISLRSESNASLVPQVDTEATSADRTAELNLSCFQQGSWSPSRRNARSTSSVIKQKECASHKSLHNLNEDVSAKELATVAPEQPSPVSVLDASFYQDGMPPSPVSKTPNTFKEHRWTPTPLPDNSSPNFSSQVNHKKLENIEKLIQKLRQLGSTDDESPTTDHCASLCETWSPDHRYVSEILLASGLLLKDISCGSADPMPIQLHPSGHLINPDLFLVLEQTKSGSFTKLECVHENGLRPKPGPEKLHRKLLFDVVNELLIQKLELASPGAQHYLMLQARKLTARFQSGQDLIRELCSKIEQVKAESSTNGRCNDDSKLISSEDVLRESDGWNEFSAEVPNVALEIERFIFKDLIDEVVSSKGASSLQTKASRQRRQLFAK